MEGSRCRSIVPAKRRASSTPHGGMRAGGPHAPARAPPRAQRLRCGAARAARPRGCASWPRCLLPRCSPGLLRCCRPCSAAANAAPPPRAQLASCRPRSRYAFCRGCASRRRRLRKPGTPFAATLLAPAPSCCSIMRAAWTRWCWSRCARGASLWACRCACSCTQHTSACRCSAASAAHAATSRCTCSRAARRPGGESTERCRCAGRARLPRRRRAHNRSFPCTQAGVMTQVAQHVANGGVLVVFPGARHARFWPRYIRLCNGTRCFIARFAVCLCVVRLRSPAPRRGAMRAAGRRCDARRVSHGRIRSRARIGRACVGCAAARHRHIRAHGCQSGRLPGAHQRAAGAASAAHRAQRRRPFARCVGRDVPRRDAAGAGRHAFGQAGGTGRRQSAAAAALRRYYQCLLAAASRPPREWPSSTRRGAAGGPACEAQSAAQASSSVFTAAARGAARQPTFR